ncbi:MAG: beta-ketoacyl-ACP synthase II [Clostridiales Family XIII bacterium]|jgi:3-oxoacyl-[acyl-carrier-protein] synthase II|nr:beta-ketoacyl-ACP synthase II [Clostridiales Family XIII bacterium]
MTERRVAITGIGAVTPVGNNVSDTWRNLLAGANGIGRITKIDTADQKVTLGAEVKDFEYPDPREARRQDLFTQYGMAAADEAFAMSGLVPGENIPGERVCAYVGSGIGGIRTLEYEMERCLTKGPKVVSPLLVPMIIGNMLSGQISIKYGIHGSAMDIVTACSCGTHCVGEAWRAIRHGYTDAVVAGAAEAPFAAVCFASFANMKAMNITEDPARASIPFDKERGGFIMGEGAGILILEEWEHAKARGANILGEVVGYGTSSDGYHITAPSPTGEQAAAAMRMAVEGAGIAPDAISYINAHGTSTPLNDLYETRAIKEVFGAAAYKTPISSTKSMIGHALGAAGGIEAVICVKALLAGEIPPTIGYKIPDEELDLDYVTEGARKVDVRYTLSNNLGFGGHNGAVVFKRFEG